MGSGWHGWRAWLAAHLPWFDPDRERQRDARADRTIRRGEVARLRAERVISEYREAAKADDKAGEVVAEAAEAVIDEARRDDD